MLVPEIPNPPLLRAVAVDSYPKEDPEGQVADSAPSATISQLEDVPSEQPATLSRLPPESEEQESTGESSVPSASFTELFDLALKPGSPLVIEVTCEGTCLSALVDSGGDTTAIRQCCVPSGARVTPCPQGTGLRGLGGVVPILGETTLVFGIPGMKIREVLAFVLPDDELSYPVLLARNYLKANRLIVDHARSEISQRIDTGVATYQCMQKASNPNEGTVIHTQLPVYVMEDVKLSDTDARPVLIYLEGALPTDYYFEPYSSLPYIESPYGILTFQTGSSQVLVRSSCSKNRGKLKRGTCIGTVSTVMDLPEDLPGENQGDGEQDVEQEYERIVKDLQLPALSPDESQRVRQMLLSLREVLSRGDDDVGQAYVTKHHIDLHDYTPVRQKVRRFAEPVEQAIEDQCKELLALDIIEPSFSPWSAPIVPIRKKDGTLRLCVDYRRLNQVTKPDRFPLPNLQDLVFGVHGMRYFTTLDLVRGYYQVPLDEESRELTAFSTPKGHYQFKRLTFGLRNAPAAFQRDLQEVLRALPVNNIFIYLDDVLICSHTFVEHLDLVYRVLKTFSSYGIKVKPAKCSWFQEEVTYLGHTIGREGLKKCSNYVQQVDQFPKPTTVTELRSFLGLVNFQRKFIPDCSTIAQPLSSQTGGKKKKLLTWTPEMDEAFEKLKEAMKQDVTLAYPDYGPAASPLELYVDASSTGAGACLQQEQEGERRVIAYQSITFSPAQQRYSVFERELAAIRWAVKSFRPFIYGVPFLLYTDHRPLTHLRTLARDNARVNRTLLELDEYDFEIRYCPGAHNCAADYLSRIAQPSTTENPLPDPDYLPPGLKLLRKEEGGGDSLVLSLWSVLEHYRDFYNPSLCLPETPRALREALVQKLHAAPKEYGVKTKRELKLMFHPGVPLGCAALLAASDLFNLDLWIHFGGDQPLIYSRGNKTCTPQPRVHLQHLAGVHYNPVIETASYVPVASHRAEQAQDTRECEHPSEAEPDTDLDLDLLVASYAASSCACQKTGESLAIVQIGEQSFCALIDTGADVSTLRYDVWMQLPESLREGASRRKGQPLRMSAIGPNWVDIEEVAELSLSINGNLLDSFLFAVIETSTPCLILGSNFLERFKIILDFDCLQFSYMHDGQRLMGCFLPAEVPPSDQSYSFVLQINRRPLFQLSPSLDYQELELVQKGDRTLRTLCNHVSNGVGNQHWGTPALKKYRRHADHLTWHDGLLWHLEKDVGVPVITWQFLVGFALTLHRGLVHAGRAKLHDAIRSLVWHPSIDSVVRDVCFSCLTCQLGKITATSPRPPIVKVESSYPMELVAADLCDVPRTSGGYCTLLVVVDHCSKWLSAEPLRDKRGKTVASAFEHKILPRLCRCPDRLLSDNGPEFCSDAFESVLDKYGISHVFSTPYHPSSNGAVERANRTLLGLLRMSEEQLVWDQALPKAVITYNHTVHRELQMSPSQWLLAKEHRLPVSLALPSEQKVWKEGHPHFAPFKPGQLVLYKLPKTSSVRTAKLKAKYDGPYVVRKSFSNGVSYEISKLEDPREVAKTAHHTQLKRFYRTPKYLLKHPAYQPLPLEPDSESDASMPDTQFLYLGSSSSSVDTSSGSTSSSSSSVPSRRYKLRRRREAESVYRAQSRPCSGIDLEYLPCSEGVPVTSTPFQERASPFMRYVLELSDIVQQYVDLAANEARNLLSPTLSLSPRIPRSSVEQLHAMSSSCPEAVSLAPDSPVTKPPELEPQCQASEEYHASSSLSDHLQQFWVTLERAIQNSQLQPSPGAATSIAQSPPYILPLTRQRAREVRDREHEARDHVWSYSPPMTRQRARLASERKAGGDKSLSMD